MTASAKVASWLMQVSQLDRSIDFYCDVFSCTIALREPDAALLLTPDGFQIYLRATESSTQSGIGDLGIQQVMWATDSEAELQRITQRLQFHYPSTYSSTADGVTFVDGCDPDGIRVLVAYPSPKQLPREVIAARFR